MILSQFQAVGRDLFAEGLVHSSHGNLSIRLGDRIIITRHGCRLSSLEENDLIETGLNKNDRFTPLASAELSVHRAIYRETTANAVVHAHGPHAVALSLMESEIMPSDNEGQELCGCVPVLGWNVEIKPGALADEVAQALKQRRIVLVRGHGTFVTGQLLEEAYNCTVAFEESCRVLCLLRSLKVKPTAE